MSIISWLKNNKLSTLLIVIVLFFLFRNRLANKNLPVAQLRTSSLEKAAIAPSYDGAVMDSTSDNSSIFPSSKAVPQPDIQERMVVENSNMSMVVDDVRAKVDAILDYINNKDGYMVNSSLIQPEETPFANLTVRLPSSELRPALTYLREMAIKVTSENLNGYDVTDQYLDIEARLDTLNKTKAKFEEILVKAEKVDDILRVQREIINLQSQIDNLIGQQKYLEKTAENALLTVYLSTDEWSLPYAPENPSFRPNVIFKQAVRSLVQTLRGIAEKLIWIVVFSVVWLPGLLVILLVRHKRKHKNI